MRTRVGRAMLAAHLAFVALLPGAPVQPVHSQEEEPEPKPPNILVIMTDDQRANTLRVMPEVRRWFRRGGTTFPNAFVTTPLCCPSRASFFTGRFGHNHGVRDNRAGTKLEQATTIQRRLREDGYLTGFVGKYFNMWPREIPPPHFDRWAMSNAKYRNASFNLNGRMRRVSAYSTDFAANRAVGMLRWFERTNDAAPWLLFVHPFAPHAPFEPAGRHRKAPVPPWRPSPAVLERDRSDKPPEVRSQDTIVRRARQVRRQQLRTLMSVDDLVAKVMRELGRLGERGETLAVFTSDHGYFWAEHGLGGKRFPYLPVLRVPLMVRWPGRISARGVDSRMMANVDLVPTYLDAAGLEPDPALPVDGRSLLQDATRDHLVFELWMDPLTRKLAWSAYLDERRIYAEYYNEVGEVTFREYYDLVNDPFQLRNLLGDADPTNDPDPLHLSWIRSALSRGTSCEGTSGASACP